MLTFRQFLIFEDLSGVYLKPKSHPGDDSPEHRWTLHHPEHGHLANVELKSKDLRPDGLPKPMKYASTASLSIHSLHNFAVPEHDIVHHTGSGPRYNIGHKGTRKLLQHLALSYPDLKTIKSQRVTGLRGDDHGNGNLGDGVVHLDRLRKQARAQGLH